MQIIGGGRRGGTAAAVGMCVWGMAMSTLAEDLAPRAIDTFTAGSTAVKIAPHHGANLFSIKYKGRELLVEPEGPDKVFGFRFGVPVLYPTPNRVRGAKMTSLGKHYAFEDNNNGNFLHGLVHSAEWKESSPPAKTDGKATFSYELAFEPGTPWFEKFPLKHVLKLAIAVEDGKVSWTYTVDNTGTEPVPFGFALHPWFLYQGPRSESFLTVPAQKVHEAKNLLPTGTLLSLEGSSFDARKPKTLDGFVIDDVYWGMTPAQPTTIDFRGAKPPLSLSLTATEDFKHLVVYTPADAKYLCVENQTNSTDAHNLHEKGLKDEANLLVAAPGKSMSGTITLAFAEGK